MSDAHTVEAKFDGVDPNTAQPYVYREVDLDRVFEIGDEFDCQNLPNSKTPSAFDHITKMARVITKRNKKKLDLTESVYQLLLDVEAIKAKLGA